MGLAEAASDALFKSPYVVTVTGLVMIIIAFTGVPWGCPSTRTAQIVLVTLGAAVSVASFYMLHLKDKSTPVSEHVPSQVKDPKQESLHSPLAEKIVGTYRVEGESIYYENIITSLETNVFKITNKAWEGVGFFDGKYYYGIFKYNDVDPARRGIWGAHKAELVREKRQRRLLVVGWEKGEEPDLLAWRNKDGTIPGPINWFKEK